jgi:hypothetical protein
MSLQTEPEAGIGITLGAKVSPATSYSSMVQIKDDMEFDGFDTNIILIPTLLVGTVAKTPGRTDNGSLTGSMYLVNADAGVAQMVSLAKSKAIVPWQVQLPDGSSPSTGTCYQFMGFVANIKPGNFTGEDSPTQDFTIAITGDVTIVAAT